MVMCMSLLIATTMLMAQNGTKKYGIKSGTISMVSEVMGQKIESTSYFDDYGNLEASNTKTFGMEIATLSRDGKMYMVNKAAKQVEESSNPISINFLDLSEATISKYKIKRIGSETVAGKDCVKYTAEITQMGQTVKATYSVWRGICMKSVVDTEAGLTATSRVISVVEGKVDPSLFIVPTFD